MQDLAPLLPAYHFGVLALDAAGFEAGNAAIALLALIGFTLAFTALALVRPTPPLEPVSTAADVPRSGSPALSP